MRMTAFNKAWQLVKFDYYFKRGDEDDNYKKKVLPGGNTQIESEGGIFQAPLLNRNRESGDPSSTWHGPSSTYSRMSPMMIPRTMVQSSTKPYHDANDESPATGQATIGWDSPPTKQPLPHYVGMNISRDSLGEQAVEGLGSKDPKEHISAFENFTGKVSSTFGHETGHALIDDEMKTNYDRFITEGRLTGMEAYDREKQATEIGASTLGHPGGWISERRAESEVKRHPRWQGGNFPDSNITRQGRVRDRIHDPSNKVLADMARRSGWI
mgnify:FL=1